VETFNNLTNIQIAPGLHTFTDCAVMLRTAISLMAAFGIIDSDLRASAVVGQDIPLTSIESSGTQNIFFGGDCNMGSLQAAVAGYASHNVPEFVKRAVKAGVDACYKTVAYAATNPSLFESLPKNLFAGDGAITTTLQKMEHLYLTQRELKRASDLCDVQGPSVGPSLKRSKEDKGQQNTIKESGDGKTLFITSQRGKTYQWDAGRLKQALGSKACHFVACSSLSSPKERNRHCPNPHCKLSHDPKDFPANWFENKMADQFRTDQSL